MFAAMSGGLLMQAFNTELPRLLVFATLKLGESQAGQERKTQTNDFAATINGSFNNKNQEAQLLHYKKPVLGYSLTMIVYLILRCQNVRL